MGKHYYEGRRVFVSGKKRKMYTIDEVNIKKKSKAKKIKKALKKKGYKVRIVKVVFGYNIYKRR